MIIDQSGDRHSDTLLYCIVCTVNNIIITDFVHGDSKLSKSKVSRMMIWVVDQWQILVIAFLETDVQCCLTSTETIRMGPRMSTSSFTSSWALRAIWAGKSFLYPLTMSYQKPECKKISNNSVSGLQGKAGDCQGDIHKGIYMCSDL